MLTRWEEKIDMKYGILTYHNIPNYGAILQAYALCAELRKLGTECEIIDYRCENIEKRELSLPQYSNPVKELAYRYFIWPHKKKQIRECVNFLQNFYSRQQYTRNTIQQSNNQYDAFISGSDMIWNFEVNGNDTSYFLDFTTEDKKRISFASSIGGSWTGTQINKAKEALKRYQAISVREKDTCEIIYNQLGIPCEVVCDPTMLLTPSEWFKLTTPVEIQNYVVVYFPYKEILTAAELYAGKTGKQLIILGTVFPWKKKNYKTIYSPQQWMSYIKYADAVFTDSYHGLLFSLYFNRPVWTNNKNNRIATLLKELQLENCYIENDPKFCNQIDYKICNEILEKKREKSINYLCRSLKEAENNAHKN